MRELEDIAEQTKVPVVSIRRQFHNLKRVVTIIEQSFNTDVKDPAKAGRPTGSILDALNHTFLLPVELASQ